MKILGPLVIASALLGGCSISGNSTEGSYSPGEQVSRLDNRSSLQLIDQNEALQIGKRLENVGLVPLSKDRVDVDSNKFISFYAHKNQALWKLVKRNGPPHLIEIKNSNWTPWKAYLYYPYQQQVWSIEESEDSLTSNVLLKGPQTLSNNLSRGLVKLDGDFGRGRFNNPPLLALNPRPLLNQGGNIASSRELESFAYAGKSELTREESFSSAKLNRNTPSLPSSPSRSSTPSLASSTPSPQSAPSFSSTQALPSFSNRQSAQEALETADLNATAPATNTAALNSRIDSVNLTDRRVWRVNESKPAQHPEARAQLRSKLPPVASSQPVESQLPQAVNSGEVIQADKANTPSEASSSLEASSSDSEISANDSYYSVKTADESLWEIARTQTGSGDNFRRLARINKISYI